MTEELFKFNLNVLLVDDQVLCLRIATIILKMMGCNVTIASGGMEALKIFHSSRCFDVIILDIQMPDVSGLQVLKEFQEVYSEIPPVVAFTSTSVLGNEWFFKKQGFDYYLSKPITLKAVLDAFLTLGLRS